METALIVALLLLAGVLALVIRARKTAKPQPQPKRRRSMSYDDELKDLMNDIGEPRVRLTTTGLSHD